MDFEEYFSNNFNDGLGAPSKHILKFTFEAGQQSKQAEIDELQKRINDALNEIESGITGKHHVKRIIKTLKENNNDT